MGMYTQIRGWLNVDSIGGFNGNSLRIQELLAQAQEDFKLNDEIEAERKWVCEDTIFHSGSNGVAYLFFGTELKNYSQDAQKWIKHLIAYFPNAEGRIDFQYEEELAWENLEAETSGEKRRSSKSLDDPDADATYSAFWLIRGGKVIKEGRDKTWCVGYGNSFPKI